MPLAWRRAHGPRAHASRRAPDLAEHLCGLDGARRGAAPRGPRMREGCRDPQCRRMALGQATRHLQCPNGSPSPAQIGRGAAQISPATAANRASGERMDDPRARARSRHAADDPLHLGPEGTSILPQHRRRLETRRAGARRSRDDRGVEGDTSHAAALAPPAATACQQQRRPHHRVLRVAMTGRYRLSSVWRNPTPSRVNQPEVV